MCPTCRFTPIQRTDAQLHVNVALRDAALGSGSGSGSSAAPAPAVPKASPNPIQIKANRITGTDKVHISLSVPAGGAGDSTMPTLFIDVIDISGSMGNSSVDTTTQAASEAAAFSRADLVRHAVATQIELLRPEDELALVLFDNTASVPLQRTPMTPTGKVSAKACLRLIQPTGGTAIWAGLQKALAIASTATDKNVVIVLQTDGESDPSHDPMRGIPDTFRGWMDANRATKVTVHTVGYGFGSALDMPLLRSLADIGGGTVNYIPDGSMVGTVFIHMMANLMSCVYRGVEIQIPSLSRRIPVGFLQADQPRDFVLTIPGVPVLEITATADNWSSMCSTTLTAATPFLSREEAAWPVIHENLIDELQKALTASELGGSYDMAPMVAAATELAANPSVNAILSDLADPDLRKGQLGKAFATRDAFSRWGRHYVPGVLSGHKNQWAINFKDEGSKIYGSAVIRALISRGETIFTSLPPPTASCRGGAAAAPVSVASFSQANYGGCFLPASLVKMAGGELKRCDEIQPGDIADKGFRIACVVKTMVDGSEGVEIVRLGTKQGGFTPWHPVCTMEGWQFPAKIGQVTRVETDAVYNFVLAFGDNPIQDKVRPGSLIVDGMLACTLGHDMVGPVIGHPYFGRREPEKRNIIDDLKEQPGWSTGHITLRHVATQRDPVTGFICGLTAE
jgi:Mg-chelatase subunit ChlD